MLRELHIENVAVIERADLELGPGLNILTGETGAGKSILVDAMHAILGARASRELVRTGAEKAVVCATFDPDPCRDWCEENEIECDDELIIRRQITAEGKTSCRVCGVPVTTAQLRTLGALLLDIHGQNDGQHLLDEREHLRNLDRFGQLEPELARYREQYQAYQALCKERDTLSTYENEKELLTESLRRQIEELERAELKAGEEAELIPFQSRSPPAGRPVSAHGSAHRLPAAAGSSQTRHPAALADRCRCRRPGCGSMHWCSWYG